MALEDINAFLLAAPGLATAGQPSAAQLREIAAEGFEIVVNLGLLDRRYCLPDEAGLVQSLGLAYHHLPVDFEKPQPEDLRRFFAVMDAAQEKKVFVHCAANKRVSCFVALYGQARLGWSLAQADSLIARIWQPNEAWTRFIGHAREELERTPSHPSRGPLDLPRTCAHPHEQKGETEC